MGHSVIDLASSKWTLCHGLGCVVLLLHDDLPVLSVRCGLVADVLHNYLLEGLVDDGLALVRGVLDLAKLHLTPIWTLSQCCNVNVSFYLSFDLSFNV